MLINLRCRSTCAGGDEALVQMFSSLCGVDDRDDAESGQEHAREQGTRSDVTTPRIEKGSRNVGSSIEVIGVDVL
jgi:hypothetical protein